MLHETKDLLNFSAATSAAVLAVALTIMALIPLVIQLVSDKVRAHFAANKAKRRAITSLVLLAASSAVLILNLILITLAALICPIQSFAATLGLILLVASLGLFGAAFVLGMLVLWNARQL